MRRVTAMLGIRRRVEGARDRYGNPVVTFSPPVDWPVYSVAPRGEAADPTVPNRNVVTKGLAVHAPLGGPSPGPHDRVVANGAEWEVVGDVGAWDRNPHVPITRHRGIVVNLERTEG